MIVVDTNVICYRWMASPYSQAADRAWAIDSEWLVPLLWRSEFRNAFAGAVRKRLIKEEAAVEIIERAEKQLAGHEFLVSSRAVMRLVVSSRCSAYDCEFVALAEENQISLVTVDRDVLRDFADIAIPLEKFAQR